MCEKVVHYFSHRRDGTGNHWCFWTEEQVPSGCQHCLVVLVIVVGVLVVISFSKY